MKENDDDDNEHDDEDEDGEKIMTRMKVMMMKMMMKMKMRLKRMFQEQPCSSPFPVFSAETRTGLVILLQMQKRRQRGWSAEASQLTGTIWRQFGRHLSK